MKKKPQEPPKDMFVGFTVNPDGRIELTETDGGNNCWIVTARRAAELLGCGARLIVTIPGDDDPRIPRVSEPLTAFKRPATTPSACT